MKCRTLLSMILLLSFFGCRSGEVATTGNASGGSPETGDWIVIRFDAEADTLNPLTSSSANATYIKFGANNSNIYESLLNSEPSDWTTPKGLLAESRPEISEDRLTYTFTVREGVKWHDGQPLTVEDVLFTFKAVVCPSVDDAPLRSYFSDLTNVELLDDRKVRFTVAKPYFMNEIVLGAYVPVTPKHIFDPKGVLDSFKFTDIISAEGRTNTKLTEFGLEFNKHPGNRAPIGTGPYKFEKWDTGKEVVLSRNDQYWGEKAYIDRIVYRFIVDGTAALTALKAGEVDFNPRLLPIQYAQQTSGAQFDQQFSKGTYTIPSYRFLAWNQERPFFKDKRVRQALTMLVNRQQIIETLRFGLGTLATGPFNPQSPDFNPNIQAFPFDPKRAAELLDQAGWTDHDGDGIRDKDGTPFRFEMVASTTEYARQLLPVLKEEFRKVGIDMRERHLEFTVFINTLRDHAFDAAESGWASDLIVDEYQVWHSSSSLNRGSNYISFRNNESDKIIEDVRLEFDAEKRKQLNWRWQELIHEEQPYTFVFYPQEAAAYQKRFQNVAFLPPRPGYDLQKWFVPKLTQRYSSAPTQ